jgi:geranylgeranyl diphosphate synthase type I
MNLVHGRAAEPRARETNRPARTPNDGALESVWPRRFDLKEIRTMLGAEADEVVCDVLSRGVNAPLWSLADRGGKRWRPTVSRLAFLVSGGRAPIPPRICQVAELLHTGSLIVDDIQDDAVERRHGPPAHVAYGVPTALNAANTAYFRALAILRHCLPDAPRLRALDMLTEELFAAHLGQALDLALGAQLRGSLLRTSHYVVLARAKTGALVRMAARLGAIAADGAPALEAALGEWASEIGVAYQITNDLDDLDTSMQDVVACRPTYPLLMALEDDGSAATALRAFLGKPQLTDADIHELRRLFERERIPERGRAAARLAGQRALTAIRLLPVGAARSELEQITHDLTA